MAIHHFSRDGKSKGIYQSIDTLWSRRVYIDISAIAEEIY